MSLTRRDLVKLGVLGSAALILPAERGARGILAQANRLDPAKFPALGQLPFRVPPTARPVRTDVTVPGTWIDMAHPAGQAPVSVGIDYYESHMRQVAVPIMPGVGPTTIWGYQGGTPGPTIHAEKGRPVLVRHFHDMPDQHPVLRYGAPKTSIHLHGNPSLPEHDGYADDLTENTQYKDYWYPATEDARTLWYHDHGVHHTASNAYMGLAGLYLLHDDEERSSGLPLAGTMDGYANPHDCPMILRDAAFESNGQLLFEDNDADSAFGDVILVNGVPWPNMRVEPRQYRFRICDTAVSRSFELALSVKGSSTNLQFMVVGTDAGITEFAIPTTRLLVGMAERYEIVIDFSKLAGKTLVLKNLRPNNNIDYPRTGQVMQFQVGPTVTDATRNATTPGQRLRQKPAAMSHTRAEATTRRTFELRRQNGNWTIDGRTWADVVASGYKDSLATPKLNDVEIWTFVNNSGGWFHPVHIHLVDFQILSRTSIGKRNGVASYEQGPKDVFYLGEYETIEVIAKFGPRPGRYMIHCHNLVHEDHDMMHQFWVKDPGGAEPDGHDPLGARPWHQPADGSLNLPRTPGGVPQMPPVVT